MIADLFWNDIGLDEALVVLFNVGNFLAVVAFIVRGPILLRALAVVGTGMQAFFYAFISTGPIVYGVFWKVLMAAAAFGFMVVLLRERMGRQFPQELRGLAQDLSLLNPGQIEKLFKAGDVKTCEGDLEILRQGENPEELFYLLEGSALVLKDGASIKVEAPTFLGEIAFVSGVPATADVRLQSGASYLVWQVSTLKALLAREDQIDIALRGLINHDLASKIAAQPVQEATQASLRAAAE